MRNILVTGGAGFIGSHLVRLLVNKYPNYHIINMDVLTYASNLENLKDIEGKENYTFVKCDICDLHKVKQIFKSDDNNEQTTSNLSELSTGMENEPGDDDVIDFDEI